jgi:hypothetical protein
VQRGRRDDPPLLPVEKHAASGPSLKPEAARASLPTPLEVAEPKTLASSLSEIVAPLP